jgi:hypothetical protein
VPADSSAAHLCIIGSRFLPGTRVATYFAAGLLKTSFWKFLLYFSVAVALWTPLLVGLASWLGARMLPWFGLFQRWALPGAAAFAVLVWLLLSLVRSLSSWPGRRRLLGALRRKLEWEFWPPWAVYLPLLPWIAWLALRHRGLTVFTAANPGIEAGGFIGESKSAILDALAAETVAAYRKIEATRPAAERLEAAQRFLDEHSLQLPAVIKPDVGERGRGVAIVRNEAQLRQALEASSTCVGPMTSGDESSPSPTSGCPGSSATASPPSSSSSCAMSGPCAWHRPISTDWPTSSTGYRQ